MALKLSLPYARFFLVAIALIAFLAVVWAMVGRRVPIDTPQQPAPEMLEAPGEADSVLKNFVYTSTDKHGSRRWRLDAETANHYKDQNLIQLDRLKITFFTDAGSTYTVTAAKGTVNTETQDFEVSGNVTGVSDDGVRFSTESLIYRADIEEARTEDRVYLESPQFDLEGRGMIMDVKNQKVSLLHEVQATGKD